MARASINNGILVVEFSTWERFFTLRRRVDIPVTAVREVATVAPLSGVRGIRRHGITVSGLLRAGHWGHGAGTRQLVAVRRSVPAARVLVDPAAGLPFDEIVVSLPDADAVVGAVRRGQEAPR
ncbi:hypothetical protein [Plantactinospora sp. CA-290183]|uniref:hypothetical protein n=1 Tax=Plantactinospora sp. CA-290183 TaxID=3240006 RepID=UPI003D8B37A2